MQAFSGTPKETPQKMFSDYGSNRQLTSRKTIFRGPRQSPQEAARLLGVILLCEVFADAKVKLCRAQ